MAQYRVEEKPEGISIEVTEVAGRQQELLEAFGKCQSGHCTCPTDEYEKLADMEVSPGSEEVALRLKAKPGTKFDPGEIASCLDYTLARVEEQ